jgi:hypothetical protein
MTVFIASSWFVVQIDIIVRRNILETGFIVGKQALLSEIQGSLSMTDPAYSRRQDPRGAWNPAQLVLVARFPMSPVQRVKKHNVH